MMDPRPAVPPHRREVWLWSRRTSAVDFSARWRKAGRAPTHWRKSTASIIREAARLGSRSIESFPAQSESRPDSQNVSLRPIAVGDSPLIPNVMRRCGHVSWLYEGVIDDFAMTVRVRART